MKPFDIFWDHCEGPIVYGVNDCCVAIADTIIAAGGPDLITAYRDSYRTERGFVRALRKAGFRTVAEACEAAMSSHGKPVDEVADFDLAVVAYRHGDRREMRRSPAFFHGGFWHVRTERGGLALAHNTFEGAPNLYRMIP